MLEKVRQKICDTGDIAYDLCEKYIVDKEGVDGLDETTNNRGYRMLSREYDTFFQEIVKAGYTLVIISHATSKQIKENGEKYDKTIPTIPNRGFLVISRLVDVTAYASYETNEDGRTFSMLTMRGNKYLEAGSRYRYTSETIPFTYDALLADMNQAIDRQEADGDKVVDTVVNHNEDVTETPELEDIIADIKPYVVAFKNADKMPMATKIIENYLGKGKLVTECDDSQIEMLVMILDDLKTQAEELELEIPKPKK